MTLLAGLAVAALAGGAGAQTDPLLDSTQMLTGRVEQAFSACGVAPAFKPSVVVETHEALVSYQPSRRTILVSRYQELPAPIQDLMTMWGSATGYADGAALFSDIFHGLLLPHEMGHWMQHQGGRLAGMDRWDSEVEANRIALAFWSLEEGDAGALPARVEAFSGFLARLPSPVPEGSDARAFFNENYETMDAMQYGWFQGEFMRQAWARRSESDFCDLVG